MSALYAAVVAGLVTFLIAAPLLRALPTPDGETTSPYTVLATRRTAAWMSSAVAGMTWLVLLQPPRLWPAGLVLATVGGIAVCIDELTCWLPKALTHAATAATLAALGAAWASGHASVHDLGRALAAGIAVRSFFWLIWRLVGTMGFGDVRLCLLCGITAGMASWNTVYTAVLLGTLLPLLGALTSHRGQKMIPYGPGLVLGCLVAMAWAT